MAVAFGGALQAELFVVWLRDTEITTLGDDGIAKWRVPLDPAAEPIDAVHRAVADQFGEPPVLHSTSWRHEEESILLTFLAVLDDPPDVDGVAVPHVGLACGTSSSAPREVDATEVLVHGLRHLAWLAAEDTEVRAALGAEWRGVLADHRREPFRAFTKRQAAGQACRAIA